MSTSNPAGSVWGKWDLQIHTPCSMIQSYGGNNDLSWNAFISDLEKLPPEFKAIGVNDYLSLDGYERLLKAKSEKNRLKNIELILPVVELRLNTFGAIVQKDKYGNPSKTDWNRINLNIIFDQLEPDTIRQRFFSALALCYEIIPELRGLYDQWDGPASPEGAAKLGKMIIEEASKEKAIPYRDPFQEGYNALCVSIESLRKALSQQGLAGHYLLALGKTEWHKMPWDDPKMDDMRNAFNAVDFLFTAALNPDAVEASRRKLRESGVWDRLVDCSDAHALSNFKHNHNRIGHCFTWIKAEPSFAGLQHAIAELDQRVFVGDTPPKSLRVSNNRTKYVDSITIAKRNGSPLQDPWFDVHLPLSHDLVAIIGNKGSGKSALADIIALTGDTRNYDGFSFLNEKRFRDPRAKLAEQFFSSLCWHDGSISEKVLHENPQPSSVERVKYLPQSFLETLCNELADSGSSRFDSELRKIIYTHVPYEERMGYLTLDELLSFKVSGLEAERKHLIEQLSKINAEVAAIERKLSPGYRESLERTLEAKHNELMALETSRPEPVENPLDSDVSRDETATASSQIAELEEELAILSAAEETARQRKADAVKGAAHVSQLVQTIMSYRKRHDQFVVELGESLTELGIDIAADAVVSLQVDTAAIDQIVDWFRKVSQDQDEILTADGPGSIQGRRAVAEEKIREITSELDERHRQYLVYKEQAAAWERSKQELQGDKDKSGTIAWLTAEIEALDALRAKRDELRAERLEIVRSLHERLGKLVEEYRTLYQPVQQFVQSTHQMDMPLPLDFDARITEEGFQESFLARINPQARSSFAGSEEGALTVRSALMETDFRDLDSVIAFVEKMDDLLHFDRRSDGTDEETALSVADQLRKGQSPEELYDDLYGLGYLSPKYALTYDGQEVSLLSPGERGLLLLVFYLLLDKDDIPLVIDQPEENLDNQTIYKVLVRCIKMAKQRRQVIMVTHNPNLAVVCDAEQIVYAACDKVNRRFTYECGAIEAPHIKARVVEILEGTEPAFSNRRRKYAY